MTSRGISSAMYYYHPYSYFSTETTRAKVVNWIPDLYFQDLLVNKDRIIKIVSREAYLKTGVNIDKQNIVFIYPSKIEYEIAPLIFYCRTCNAIKSFNNIEHLKNYIDKNHHFRCNNIRDGKKCNGSMVQMGHVFVCPCGRIDEIDAQSHCNKPMLFIKPTLDDVSTWIFQCQICGAKKPLEKYCPRCGERMSLKPCDSSGVTIPLSITIPSYAEPKITWILEYFNWDLKMKSSQFDTDEDADLIEELRKRKAERLSLNNLNKISNNRDTQELIKDKILDYMAIKSCQQNEKSINPMYGIEKLYLVDGIKFVQCIYAFAVGTYDFNIVKNKNGFRFFIDKEKYQVLSRVLETEGILLEFSKKLIIEWLKINGLLKNNPEKPLNEWFIDLFYNNNNLEIKLKIKELIHTISHSLIKTAPIFSGIDANSIRETLFPEIPAILLYNNSNSTLGNMRTLFETKLEEWFNAANEELENCIHDPICINEKNGASCIGCIMLSEVSCEEFNIGLNRRSIIGHGTEIGYWRR